MPSFPVTITVESTPLIEVFGVNITYEEILQSLGSYFYSIQKLFIESLSSDFAQVNESISFERFDSNGNKNTDIASPNIDPYQKLPSLMLDLSNFKLIADGRLIMTFTILSGSKVRYTFITQRGSVSFGLDKFSPSNQQQVKTMQ